MILLFDLVGKMLITPVCLVKSSNHFYWIDSFFPKRISHFIHTLLFSHCDKLMILVEKYQMPFLGRICFTVLFGLLEFIFVCIHLYNFNLNRLKINRKSNIFTFLFDVSMLLIVFNLFLNFKVIDFQINYFYRLLLFLIGTFVLFIISTSVYMWTKFCINDCKYQKQTLKNTWPYQKTEVNNFSNGHCYTSPSICSDICDLTNGIAETKLSPRSTFSLRPSVFGSVNKRDGLRPIRSNSLNLNDNDDLSSNDTFVTSISQKNCDSDYCSFAGSRYSLCCSHKSNKSRGSKRKRKKGLFRFVFFLLFGRLESWEDVCFELKCFANVFFIGIMIYTGICLLLTLFRLIDFYILKQS